MLCVLDVLLGRPHMPQYLLVLLVVRTLSRVRPSNDLLAAGGFSYRGVPTVGAILLLLMYQKFARLCYCLKRVGWVGFLVVYFVSFLVQRPHE